MVLTMIVDPQGYANVQLESDGDVYQLRLLSYKETAVAWTKALALLTPTVAASVDEIQQYNKANDRAKADEEDGYEVDQPVFNFFDIAVVFAQQMDKPLFHEMSDLLLKYVTKNGKPIDPEDEFRGKFNLYLKLLEFSFKANLYSPFVKWLEDQGFLQILTSLQPLLSGLKALTKP